MATTPTGFRRRNRSRKTSRLIDVAIVVHDDGRVVIDGDDLNLTVWDHDPVRLRSAVDYWGRAV